MKKRFFATAAIAVLLFNVVALSAGDTQRAAAKKRAAARLVAMMPASDGIAVFDSKRFFDESLPAVLASNQPILAQIQAKLVEMETRTGIDLRKFEQLAVGVSVKQISPTETDFEPVAIVSGDISAAVLIAVARMASKGSYREEKIGDKTVYVFSAKEMVQKTPPAVSNSKVAAYVEKAVNGLSKDVAVTALDRNTLVFGSLERVKETLAGQTHVAPDVSALLNVTETAVAAFAFKAPDGMAKLLPLDKDQFGMNIDSIKYVSGSLDINAVGSSVHLMARTVNAEQAKSLKETIDGLKLVGGAFLGSSKRTDQQVYGRMIKNTKIDLRGTDVTLDLTVPQGDIDILVGGVK